MDWRFFASGIALIASGVTTAILFNAYVASGPLEEINQNRTIAQFGGIMGGIGILLLLVSFGFSRRKRRPDGGMDRKPNESS